MKDYIEERAVEIAYYIIENKFSEFVMDVVKE